MDNKKTFGSSSFTFEGIDWGKVGAGAAVAVAGALLTYITSWITGQDFGPMYTPIVMGIWTIISNIVRKWTSSIE